MAERLRIAIQKKGRLAEASVSVLKRAGLKFNIRGDELLMRVRNMDVDLLRVRDDDIPSFVAMGACEVGIIGENVLQEELYTTHKELDLSVDMPLGFSKCQLCLAVPKDQNYSSLSAFNGKKIATTYPGILNAFLIKNNITAQCVAMKGAVELAPSIGIADVICDLVSSGATLKANNLKMFQPIFDSQAMLISKQSSLSSEQTSIYTRLKRRISGVIKSDETKYIMLNAPKDKLDAITALLPGSDAPTIIPLAGQDNLVAVQAVCTEAIFWETLEEIKALGARSILVLPIEKMLS